MAMPLLRAALLAVALAGSARLAVAADAPPPAESL